MWMVQYDQKDFKIIDIVKTQEEGLLKLKDAEGRITQRTDEEKKRMQEAIVSFRQEAPKSMCSITSAVNSICQEVKLIVDHF